MNPRLDRAYASYQRLAAFDPLRYMGSNFVRGDGPVPATLMFIGEAPGYNEDEQRKPFVGPSGHILNKALTLAGIKRDECFITNVLKYRPPRNRDPLQAEVEASVECLRVEVRIVNPTLVVMLGRHAYHTVFPTGHLSKDHGTVRSYRDRLWLPVWHPAFAARNKVAREQFEFDIQTILHVIGDEL